jgi:hypothetical protein
MLVHVVIFIFLVLSSLTVFSGDMPGVLALLVPFAGAVAGLFIKPLKLYNLGYHILVGGAVFFGIPNIVSIILYHISETRNQSFSPLLDWAWRSQIDFLTSPIWIGFYLIPMLLFPFIRIGLIRILE